MDSSRSMRHWKARCQTARTGAGGGKDGQIQDRPGRVVTMSAPKSVSLMVLMGCDERIVEAHDRAVTATLGLIEKNAILTRVRDGTTGAMVHAGTTRRWWRPSARHFEESGPPVAHSLRHRQPGAGRGQPLTHDGQ